MEISLDDFRYVVALLVLLCAPPALLVWLLIHPFVSIWRRLGTVVSYLLFISLMSLLILCTWWSRGWLLRIEYGSQVWLFGPSLLLLFAVGFVRVKRKERLDWSMVIGLPELSAPYHSRVLVTQGIYARVRNPRYIETILFYLGLAFFANYLVVYLALLCGLPILHLVVILEEHELTQVFGDDYLNYCRKVPRYIPNTFQ